MASRPPSGSRPKSGGSRAGSPAANKKQLLLQQQADEERARREERDRARRATMDTLVRRDVAEAAALDFCERLTLEICQKACNTVANNELDKLAAHYTAHSVWDSMMMTIATTFVTHDVPPAPRDFGGLVGGAGAIHAPGFTSSVTAAAVGAGLGASPAVVAARTASLTKSWNPNISQSTVGGGMFNTSGSNNSMSSPLGNRRGSSSALIGASSVHGYTNTNIMFGGSRGGVPSGAAIDATVPYTPSGAHEHHLHTLPGLGSSRRLSHSTSIGGNRTSVTSLGAGSRPSITPGAVDDLLKGLDLGTINVPSSGPTLMGPTGGNKKPADRNSPNKGKGRTAGAVSSPGGAGHGVSAHKSAMKKASSGGGSAEGNPLPSPRSGGDISGSSSLATSKGLRDRIGGDLKPIAVAGSPIMPSAGGVSPTKVAFRITHDDEENAIATAADSRGVRFGIVVTAHQEPGASNLAASGGGIAASSHGVGIGIFGTSINASNSAAAADNAGDGAGGDSVGSFHALRSAFRSDPAVDMPDYELTNPPDVTRGKWLVDLPPPRVPCDDRARNTAGLSIKYIPPPTAAPLGGLSATPLSSGGGARRARSYTTTAVGGTTVSRVGVGNGGALGHTINVASPLSHLGATVAGGGLLTQRAGSGVYGRGAGAETPIPRPPGSGSNATSSPSLSVSKRNSGIFNTGGAGGIGPRPPSASSTVAGDSGSRPKSSDSRAGGLVTTPRRVTGGGGVTGSPGPSTLITGITVVTSRASSASPQHAGNANGNNKSNANNTSNANLLAAPGINGGSGVTPRSRPLSSRPETTKQRTQRLKKEAEAAAAEALRLEREEDSALPLDADVESHRLLRERLKRERTIKEHNVNATRSIEAALGDPQMNNKPFVVDGSKGLVLSVMTLPVSGAGNVGSSGAKRGGGGQSPRSLPLPTSAASGSHQTPVTKELGINPSQPVTPAAQLVSASTTDAVDNTNNNLANHNASASNTASVISAMIAAHPKPHTAEGVVLKAATPMYLVKEDCMEQVRVREEAERRRKQLEDAEKRGGSAARRRLAYQAGIEDGGGGEGGRTGEAVTNPPSQTPNARTSPYRFGSARRGGGSNKYGGASAADFIVPESMPHMLIDVTPSGGVAHTELTPRPIAMQQQMEERYAGGGPSSPSSNGKFGVFGGALGDGVDAFGNPQGGGFTAGGPSTTAQLAAAAAAAVGVRKQAEIIFPPGRMSKADYNRIVAATTTGPTSGPATAASASDGVSQQLFGPGNSTPLTMGGARVPSPPPPLQKGAIGGSSVAALNGSGSTAPALSSPALAGRLNIGLDGTSARHGNSTTIPSPFLAAPGTGSITVPTTPIRSPWGAGGSATRGRNPHQHALSARRPQTGGAAGNSAAVSGVAFAMAPSASPINIGATSAFDTVLTSPTMAVVPQKPQSARGVPRTVHFAASGSSASPLMGGTAAAVNGGGSLRHSFKQPGKGAASSIAVHNAAALTEDAGSGAGGEGF